jgi:signal transduction histidine kinase
VTEIVAQALSVCAREAQERNVTIDRDLDAQLHRDYMDPERLLQVMSNVLQNAIQHSKPGGKVTIAARTVTADGTRWVECWVADEGPGFREADLPKVFEPFFTRRKGGTGLGLSIVQRIVDVHRGKVWASNRPPPQGGGVITVRLPVPEVPNADARVGR